MVEWLEQHPGLAAWAQVAVGICALWGLLLTYRQLRSEAADRRAAHRAMVSNIMNVTNLALAAVSSIADVTEEEPATVGRVGIPMHGYDMAVRAMDGFSLSQVHDQNVIADFETLRLLPKGTPTMLDSVRQMLQAGGDAGPGIEELKSRARRARELRDRIAAAFGRSFGSFGAG